MKNHLKIIKQVEAKYEVIFTKQNEVLKNAYKAIKKISYDPLFYIPVNLFSNITRDRLRKYMWKYKIYTM